MKKYLVIGNPVEHSLSPKLHNYWIKENNVDAIYEKKQLEVNEIKKIIDEIKNNKINGVNVTLPHKKSVIPFLDELTSVAKHTESVNTIYKKNDKIIGDNTDVGGFELSLKNINFNVQKKNIFILGAGGVTPSIILALKQMKASKIFLSNRTKTKAENLKNKFPFIEIVNWGDLKKFDIIINTTSVGLKKNDEIKLNFTDVGPNKLFYDVIYNPDITNFLLKGKECGNQIENGKYMFVYQAQLAFEIWHNIKPKIDKKVLEFLSDD